MMASKVLVDLLWMSIKDVSDRITSLRSLSFLNYCTNTIAWTYRDRKLMPWLIQIRFVLTMEYDSWPCVKNSNIQKWDQIIALIKAGPHKFLYIFLVGCLRKHVFLLTSWNNVDTLFATMKQCYIHESFQPALVGFSN